MLHDAELPNESIGSDSFPSVVFWFGLLGFFDFFWGGLGSVGFFLVLVESLC